MPIYETGRIDDYIPMNEATFNRLADAYGRLGDFIIRHYRPGMYKYLSFGIAATFVIVIPSAIGYLAGRTVTPLTGEKCDFFGLLIQVAFMNYFKLKLDNKLTSLPERIKRHLPTGMMREIPAIVITGIAGEKLTNLIGLHAPFYLMPLGMIALDLTLKMHAAPVLR